MYQSTTEHGNQIGVQWPDLHTYTRLIGVCPLASMESNSVKHLTYAAREQEELIFNRFGVDVRERSIEDSDIFFLKGEVFDNVYFKVFDAVDKDKNITTVGSYSDKYRAILIRERNDPVSERLALLHEQLHAAAFRHEGESRGESYLLHGYKFDGDFTLLDEGVVKLLTVEMAVDSKHRDIYAKSLSKNPTYLAYYNRFMALFQTMHERDRDYKFDLSNYLDELFKGYFDGEFDITYKIGRVFGSHYVNRFRDIHSLADVDKLLIDLNIDINLHPNYLSERLAGIIA